MFPDTPRGRALLLVSVFVLADALLVGCGAPFEAVALPGFALVEGGGADTGNDDGSVDGADGSDAAIGEGGAAADAGDAADAADAAAADGADAEGEASDADTPDVEAGRPCTTSWGCWGMDGGGFDPTLGYGFCCEQGGAAACAATCPSGHVVCTPNTTIPCPSGLQSCVVVDGGLALCQ